MNTFVRFLLPLALAVSVAESFAADPGAVTVSVPVRTTGGSWTESHADVPFVRDLSKVDTVTFDITISDPSEFFRYRCWFLTARGGKHRFEFEPESDLSTNQTCHVTFEPRRMRIFGTNDGPGGLKQVVTLRCEALRTPASVRGGTVTFSNFRFHLRKPEPTAAESDAAARRLAQVGEFAGRRGERRLIWCHSAFGMSETNDWESSCRLIAESGFTDLIDNLSWGGCAFYDSKVVPRATDCPDDMLEDCKAACRRHGLKLHAWRVCWRCNEARSPAAFVDQLKREDRFQVSVKGEPQVGWMCPSDPRNQELEIAAMVELAKKGVDGIHFDYIRYPDGHSCFCANCRRRFERQIGHPVARWPKDAFLSSGCEHAAWVAFRCANIGRVVESVSKRVRAECPGVEISVAANSSETTAASLLGQDWPAWCRRGLVDFVCPMDYHAVPARFARKIVAQRDLLADTGVKFYPGIGIACSHYPPIDALTAAREIDETRRAGLDGFTVFALGTHAQVLLPQLRTGPLRNE